MYSLYTNMYLQLNMFICFSFSLSKTFIHLFVCLFVRIFNKSPQCFSLKILWMFCRMCMDVGNIVIFSIGGYANIHLYYKDSKQKLHSLQNQQSVSFTFFLFFFFYFSICLQAYQQIEFIFVCYRGISCLFGISVLTKYFSLIYLYFFTSFLSFCD